MTLFPSAKPIPTTATGAYLLQFDGGSRGNPGPGGIGVTLKDPSGKTVYELAEHLGHCTSNVAEYTALVRGLEAAVALGVQKLTIRADSELVVRQLNGMYKVKSPTLRPHYLRATALLARLHDAKITHVYRESNSRADALANLAMDRESKIEPLGPLPHKP